MALKRYRLFIIIFLLVATISEVLFARQSKMPIIATKQSIRDIRLITKGGKYTYYQKNNGSLMLSRNFDVKVIHKDIPGTNYQVYLSPIRKNIIISKDVFYHTLYSSNKLLNLYISSLGTFDLKEIGKGVMPQLHLNDSWISFYNPNNKTIFLKSLIEEGVETKIKVFNKIFPYFIPMVFMISETSIIYSDINHQGYQGLLHYSKTEKKIIPFLKSNSISTKLNFCTLNGNVYVGKFGIDSDNKTSSILQISEENILTFKKTKTIYESRSNDIGNMICLDDKIFFIKELSNSSTEVASLSLKNNHSIKIESDLQHVTQIIKMDNKVLVPYNGKYYLLHGLNNLGDDRLKN